MKVSVFTLLFFVAISFSEAAPPVQGGVIGNGGGGVYCQASPQNQLEGFYLLDQILALTSGLFSQQSYPTSGEASIAIAQTLSSKLGVYGLSPFMRQFEQAVKWGQEQPAQGSTLWIKAAGLTNVNDDRLFERLPKNCQNLQDDRMIHQVVRRVPLKTQTLFYYDAHLIQELDKAERMSWLLVHEWLWEYLENADMVRLVNQYLHSQEFVEASALTVMRSLRTLTENRIFQRDGGRGFDFDCATVAYDELSRRGKLPSDRNQYVFRHAEVLRLARADDAVREALAGIGCSGKHLAASGF